MPIIGGNVSACMPFSYISLFSGLTFFSLFIMFVFFFPLCIKMSIFLANGLRSGGYKELNYDISELQKNQGNGGAQATTHRPRYLADPQYMTVMRRRQRRIPMIAFYSLKGA
jgi:hypothetical protein